MDAYKQSQGFVQQGKGTGNTVWMFTPPDMERAKLDNLFVHEASHALMLMHAHMPGAMEHLHDGSTEKKCVMSYARPEDNLGGYCGKCLAHLMGVWILREPLTKKSDLLFNPEAPPTEIPEEGQRNDAGDPPSTIEPETTDP